MTLLLRALLPRASKNPLSRRASSISGRPGRTWKRTFASDGFGQPLHETHPHLLEHGELTPGITALEYAQRRKSLADSLAPGSIAVLCSTDVKWRTGSVFHKFHQDPDFFYLTGFDEPEAFAIIDKPTGGREHKFRLLVRPKDAASEKWEGSRSGFEAAEEVFNADESGDSSQVSSMLSPLLAGAAHVYSNISPGQSDSAPFSESLRVEKGTPKDGLSELLQKYGGRPLRPFINDLRAVKSDAEISNMRRAGQASGKAFTEAMKRQFMTERELETFLEYRFKSNGCENSAYIPVVASGEHALQIHYVQNNDMMRDGDLVSVDAGGSYGGYVTDITRTWPVNGKFSSAQRDLYEAILDVQRSCVSRCRQDANLSLDALHSIAEAGLKENLAQIGFDFPRREGIKALFPHHLGHHVGLDIHDCAGYSRTSNLIKGQCITIEPGIYVDADDDRWPAHFRGMGIRIEDSVCVQEDSPFVFTTEAVKEVSKWSQ
ncbi:MAG: hypothetical protein M1831_004107 [Alyxoria varia]|nr:MAG: hypothetical protein M1831_004107 [Alyxoria varia]